MDALERASDLHEQAQDSCDSVPRDMLDAGLRDSSPLVRHVALVWTAHLCPSDLTPERLHELVGTLMCSLADQWPPWHRDYVEATRGNSLDQDILLALAELDQSFLEALEQLDAQLSRDLIATLFSSFQQDPQFYEIAHALVGLTFPRCRSDAASQPITDLQKSVLEALLGNSAIWTCDGDLPGLLADHALPKTRKGVCGLIGQYETFKRPRPGSIFSFLKRHVFGLKRWD